ncbi:MAG: hypothetical protein ABSB60_19065 [Terracidiphilus sp.]
MPRLEPARKQDRGREVTIDSAACSASPEKPGGKKFSIVSVVVLSSLCSELTQRVATSYTFC